MVWLGVVNCQGACVTMTSMQHCCPVHSPCARKVLPAWATKTDNLCCAWQSCMKSAAAGELLVPLQSLCHRGLCVWHAYCQEGFQGTLHVNHMLNVSFEQLGVCCQQRFSFFVLGRCARLLAIVQSWNGGAHGMDQPSIINQTAKCRYVALYRACMSCTGHV